MDSVKQPSRKVLFAALAASVLAISSAATLIKLADAPALVVAAGRMLIAAILLWTLSPWTGAFHLKSVPWKSVGLAGFFLALHFGFWITSLTSTSVASSLVLVTMNPVVVAIGSTIFLREPPTKPLLAGTALSIAGCMILVIGESYTISNSLNGNLLALGGAIAMSFYMMIGRHTSGRRKQPINLLCYLTWISTISGILLFVGVLISGVPLSGYSSHSVMFIVLIALLPQLVGHSLINWSLRYLHTSYLAAAILIEPLAGTIIAFLVIGETFSRYSFFGGLLILSGVGLAFRRVKASSG
ncbi:DMT family transporter [bacterium]|nr:DMT family transporter [candidate division CSSED10-310 bacterium]